MKKKIIEMYPQKVRAYHVNLNFMLQSNAWPSENSIYFRKQDVDDFGNVALAISFSGK